MLGERVTQAPGPMVAYHDDAEEHVWYTGKYDDRGQRTGVWTYYDRNGMIIMRGRFQDNHKSGIWFEYKPSRKHGPRLELGFYNAGKRTGHWHVHYSTSYTCKDADELKMELFGIGFPEYYILAMD